MKKKIRFTGFATAVISLVILSACAPGQQREENGDAAHDHAAGTTENHHEHAASGASDPVFENEQLAGAYQHYIHLKDALVASDANEAKTAAAALQVQLKEIAGAEKAAQLASSIAESADLEAQRGTFSGLSTAMAEMVKASAPASGEVYLAFCPMANDHAGAYWLSNEKEIRNPYFGEKMMNCGEIKETIK